MRARARMRARRRPAQRAAFTRWMKSDEATAFVGTRAAMTFGGFLGGGVDVLLGRRWSLGVSAGYNWMADFSQTIGTRRNFSGVDVGIGIGWMWGKGDEP